MKDSTQIQSTRDAILDATDRLLARSGYKKMTIDDLAKEVGIGKGSIYLHFSSKEEIALSHIDRIIEKLKEHLNSIAEGNGNSTEKIKTMLVERVLFRFDSVQHYSQSLDELLVSIRPRLLERRKVYFETEAAIFARVVGTGINDNEFADGEAIDLARTILTATNSLLPFSLTNLELDVRNDIKAKTIKVADLLVAGLRRF